jgi:hypothetical protein
MSPSARHPGLWLALVGIAGAAIGAGATWAARARTAPAPCPTATTQAAASGVPKPGCCHGEHETAATKCPVHYEGEVLKIDDQARTRRLRQVLHDGLFVPWTDTGRAPAPDEFARRLNIPQPEADRLLDELQACGESVGGGILRVPGSELVAVAWPLSNVPTGITVTVAGGKPAFARCAIDALGVSAMLGKRTVVEGTARDNGHRLRVVVDGARFLEAEPAGLVVVRGNGCDNMSFFSSRAAGDAWRKANDPGSTLLTLAEAVARGARIISAETQGL